MSAGAQITPMHPASPRVLVHARGRLDPAECRFWGRLRVSLRARGLELLLIAHHPPQAALDVPVTTVPNMLDAPLPPDEGHGWRRWWPATHADDEELLDRERAWRGPDRSESHARRRREGLAFYRAFYAEAVRAARPSVAMIWNGTHAQEMVFDRECRASGCPVLYIERGPVPGTIHVDPDGILAASRVARRPGWGWESARAREAWLEVFGSVASELSADARTWWDQPASEAPDAFRASHGVRPTDLVLLFAGQVDRDAQNLFFSDAFPTNLAAYEWFLAQLPRDRSDLFVLGKHHPRSDTPPERYREALERAAARAAWRGVWAESLDMRTALSLADRAAGVNSTVLFEAQTHGLPVLMLGRGVMSGKQIAHEPALRGPAAVGDWLAAADAEERSHRFRDFGAYLLAHELYDFTLGRRDLRGADALAEHLALDHYARAVVPPPLGAAAPLLEHVASPRRTAPTTPEPSRGSDTDGPDAFLISSPRSGTTWLQTALNAHPEVACIEQRLFGDHADLVRDHANTRPRLRVTLDRYVDALGQHLAGGLDMDAQQRTSLLRAQSAATVGLVRRWSNATTVVDKVTPYVGTAPLVIERIRSSFPGAKLVHLVRDGRDVAVSGVMHWLTKSVEGVRESPAHARRRRWLLERDDEAAMDRFFLAGELEEWARTWSEPARAATRADAGQDHVVITYEQMLAAAAPTLTRLLGHLGVRADEPAVRACVESSSFGRMSGGRRPGDDRPGAHVRNGTAGDWRRWFTRDDGRRFDELTGDTLRALGYAADERWWRELPERLSQSRAPGPLSPA